MEPVAIELTHRGDKPISLRVPRAYIREISQPGEIAQTFITLVVYLPDYLPRALADQAGHTTRGQVINGIQLRSKEEIAIYVRATRPGAIAKYIELQRSDRIHGGTFEGKFDLYYDVYQPSPQAQPTPRKESGYLIPLDRDDLIISFYVNLNTSEMLGCRMQFELERLSLEVSFSSKYLSEYTLIRDRISELIQPFIVR